MANKRLVVSQEKEPYLTPKIFNTCFFVSLLVLMYIRIANLPHNCDIYR